MLINSYVSYALSVLGRSERTVTEYAKEIRAFAKWLAPDLEPSDALPLAVRSNVNAYLEHCLKNGNAASTRARKISALRMFYNYLVEQGVIDVNPIAAMPRPSVPRPMPRFLNLDDCRLLIRTARARNDIFYRRRNTCIIVLFLNIGLRLSELAGITLPDIYSDVILIRGKGNRERFVYLNKSCQRAVRLWMSHRRSETESLFVSKQGEPLSPSSIYSVVKNLLAEAGLSDRHLSPHKLRHTCATLMYMSGTDIRLLQGVLGHASIATTEIYTHIMSEQMMDAFRNHPLAEF